MLAVELTLASPKVATPHRSKSDLPENQTPAMARFKKDKAAQKDTGRNVSCRHEIGGLQHYFYVGGHGPMWDLVDNPDSIRLIESF